VEFKTQRYLSPRLGKGIIPGSRQRRALSLALREAQHFITGNLAYYSMDL
jgi:hypothetical protein